MCSILVTTELLAGFDVSLLNQLTQSDKNLTKSNKHVLEINVIEYNQARAKVYQR